MTRIVRMNQKDPAFVPVFPIRWLQTSLNKIGVGLYINETGEQQAYICEVEGLELEEDTIYIKLYGAKIQLQEAKGFFPKLDPTKYKIPE